MLHWVSISRPDNLQGISFVFSASDQVATSNFNGRWYCQGHLSFMVAFQKEYLVAKEAVKASYTLSTGCHQPQSGRVKNERPTEQPNKTCHANWHDMGHIIAVTLHLKNRNIGCTNMLVTIGMFNVFSVIWESMKINVSTVRISLWTFGKVLMH